MDGAFSLRRQCELLGLNRSGLYYRPTVESDENLALMRLLDEQYTRTPCYGVLRMAAYLRSLGHEVNPKRVRRLLRTMGLEAVYQKPGTSQPNPEHKIYPYLLRGLPIDRCDQVWSADITYVRLSRGFVYLMAVIDWYNDEHRHSGIRFVTPGERHRGEDIAILAQRKAVYEAARREHPERWSGGIRNWERPATVSLNPDKSNHPKRPETPQNQS